MKENKLAVVAAPQHQQWLVDWCARAELRDELAFFPIAHAGTATAEVASLLARHEQAPFHATLMLVNGEAVAWARAVLPLIAAAGAKVALIARSMRPTGLRQLLAHGAHDFILWDCKLEEMKLRLWKLCAGAPGKAPSGEMVVTRHPRLAKLIGSSPLFVQQLERIPVMAACDAGVLILGETGTGKELCAQAVHYLSSRADHPWVAVNCGALPPDLMESELFGHVRGAFTGASETRMGLVAQAQGGTLFLDEVDSLPPLAQVKLLRFLQDEEYRPVGSTRTHHADVRIIAASNGDLAELCRRGGFRTDLFYRLNVLTLNLPALRERAEDVIPLAQYFVERFAHEFGRPVAGLSAAARERIAAYAWPGNIRELEHAVERGVLLAPGASVRAEDLGLPEAMESPTTESFRAAKAKAVEQFERRYIEHVLSLCAGNITHAATTAAKNRRAFWQLMRKHRIDSRKYRGMA